MELIIKTSIELADTSIPKEYQEEIIRCRFCKHSRSENRYCSRDAYDGTEWLHIEPNGFCAWAERVD